MSEVTVFRGKPPRGMLDGAVLVRSFSLFAILLGLTGCARGGHDEPDASRRVTLVDSGPSSSMDDAAASMGADGAAQDVGSSSSTDASSGPTTDAATPADAASPRPDAFTPMPDAAPPPGPDAGPPGPPCTPVPTVGSLAISGTSAGAPTWARPSATFCPAVTTAGGASAVPRVAHVFCNPGAAGTFDFTLEGIGLSDPYLVLYDGAGIPADPLACFDADDDGYGFGDSEIVGVTVPTGISFTLVATGYGNSDSGSYRLTIWRR